jgi:hypothetical protein
MTSVNIDPQLYDVINADFKKLKDNSLGSDARKAALDEVTKLMDRAIEIKKVDIDSKNKAATLESEQLMRKQQMEDEKKDRLIKNIISVAGIVLPIGLTIWGTKVSLKFEEEGTVTTIMGRGFINKLLPKK